MNGYVCFWEQKREEIHAYTSSEAHALAMAAFQKHMRKKVKSHQVFVVIAERDGQDVVHSPASI